MTVSIRPGVRLDAAAQLAMQVSDVVSKVLNRTGSGTGLPELRWTACARVADDTDDRGGPAGMIATAVVRPTNAQGLGVAQIAADWAAVLGLRLSLSGGLFGGGGLYEGELGQWQLRLFWIDGLQLDGAA